MAESLNSRLEASAPPEVIASFDKHVRLLMKEYESVLLAMQTRADRVGGVEGAIMLAGMYASIGCLGGLAMRAALDEFAGDGGVIKLKERVSEAEVTRLNRLVALAKSYRDCHRNDGDDDDCETAVDAELDAECKLFEALDEDDSRG